MNEIPMNLEQTVQYLLDEVNKLKAGIAPGELIPGPQGVQGPEGQKPEVSISNATGNWVIDGVDTGKPSRGKQGERGNTGMQGVPGVGVSTMLSIDSTDYTPTVTDDGEYQDVESSADIKYSDGGVEHSTQVDFNIKVPDHETFAGDGLTKNGRTLSVDRNMTPVYNDFGHYAGLVPMTVGDRVWGQAFVSNDPTPYAIAQRNSSGGLTGIQDQLYRHSGYLEDPDGYYYNYTVLSRTPTAFTTIDQLEDDDALLFPDVYEGFNSALIAIGFDSDKSGDFRVLYTLDDETHIFYTDETIRITDTAEPFN